MAAPNNRSRSFRTNSYYFSYRFSTIPRVCRRSAVALRRDASSNLFSHLNIAAPWQRHVPICISGLDFPHRVQHAPNERAAARSRVYTPLLFYLTIRKLRRVVDNPHISPDTQERTSRKAEGRGDDSIMIKRAIARTF